ncbi:hypothetical protein AAG906_021596 [Vitis piasezkii]
MMSNRTRCDIDWKALEDAPTLAHGTMGPEVPTPTILVSSSTPMPRCNGRIVMQLDRFMYLGESFKAILEKHKTDPINCNEAMCNDGVILWQ